MSSPSESQLTAFAGFRRIASGPRAKVIAQVRKQCAHTGQVPPFVFDDSTGERLDIDLREDASPAPAATADEPAARGVGRPRLGVVAREATYRFMSVIAGDLPHFEEAARALFAGDRARFDTQVATWPEDVQAHLHKLAAAAWSAAA